MPSWPFLSIVPELHLLSQFMPEKQRSESDDAKVPSEVGFPYIQILQILTFLTELAPLATMIKPRKRGTITEGQMERKAGN